MSNRRKLQRKAGRLIKELEDPRNPNGKRWKGDEVDERDGIRGMLDHFGHNDVSMIPYTHWAYFEDEASGQACGIELSQAGFHIISFGLVGQIDGQEYDWCMELRGKGPYDDFLWLLRAQGMVSIDSDYYAPVVAIVERHGGEHRGGEATWGLDGMPMWEDAIEELSFGQPWKVADA